MKIRVATTKLKEIGELDLVRRLPNAVRLRKGMETTCCRCGKPVTDEHFIAGFKAGYPNMIFHETCAAAVDEVPNA